MQTMYARKGTGGGLMRNVSSSFEEKYQTWDGNVTVTNLKRGLWSVHPRGYAPFMVGSKREAFDQALGLSAKAGGTKPAAHSTRARSRGRRHHATIQESPPSTSDAWDVAMDALLERNPARAASIVKEHGLTKMTPAFSKALGKVPKSVRNAFEKATGLTKEKEPPAAAVAFFRKHAGYSIASGETKAQGKTRGAKALARAEMEAKARGWTVEWEDDPEEWQGDVERPFEVLNATLYDAEGQVLDSMGGVGMTGNRKQDDDYRRVIEAELANSVLP